MKFMKLMLAGAMASTFTLDSIAADPVPYPAGYRDWTHAKSMVIQPGHPLENPFQGIHHVYVNDAAKRGLQSGRYADGAVFVFDLLDYVEGGKALQEGKRKLIGVMQRDSERYAATGGWGFEAFLGDSNRKRIVEDGGAGCFNCHEQKKDADYVFTQYRK